MTLIKVVRNDFDEFIGIMQKPPLSKFKRLDVRPLLKVGAEVLPVILEKVQLLKPDEGLMVTAPFLPSPLIELLSSQGLAFKVEPGDGGSWIVYFWIDGG